MPGALGCFGRDGMSFGGLLAAVLDPACRLCHRLKQLLATARRARAARCGARCRWALPCNRGHCVRPTGINPPSRGASSASLPALLPAPRCSRHPLQSSSAEAGCRVRVPTGRPRWPSQGACPGLALVPRPPFQPAASQLAAAAPPFPGREPLAGGGHRTATCTHALATSSAHGRDGQTPAFGLCLERSLAGRPCYGITLRASFFSPRRLFQPLTAPARAAVPIGALSQGVSVPSHYLALPLFPRLPGPIEMLHPSSPRKTEVWVKSSQIRGCPRGAGRLPPSQRCRPRGPARAAGVLGASSGCACWERAQEIATRRAAFPAGSPGARAGWPPL
ncbi:uncharacterized protein LOC134152413 [Rhea pennata]|uniref:uncharacterized protein LOC134152413 n=1 Tax=Rhea pennata TaxID=8795 RepID=UPI002E26BCD4